MVSGFQYVEETLGKRFTSDDYKELHKRCLAHVIRVSPESEQFGSIQCCYGFKEELATEEALEELETYQLVWGSTGKVENYLSTQVRDKIYQIGPPDAIKQKVNRLFTAYYCDLAKATTSREKLRQIVILCRGLEILHAFSDGNQRTVVSALLTKLLIENGFSPSAVEMPIAFDGYRSVDQLVLAVEEGVAFYISRLQ